MKPEDMPEEEKLFSALKNTLSSRPELGECERSGGTLCLPPPLPSLERVLLLQRFQRLAPHVLESFCLVHQRRHCLGPLAVDSQQALRRNQSRRHFNEVSRSRSQILRFGRIADPHPLLACQLRLPVNFSFRKLRHHVVRGFAKHPLLPL